MDDLLKTIRKEVADKSLPPLLNREMKSLKETSSKPILRIMQWNVLAQGLTGGEDNFVKCPSEALDLKVRKLRIPEEILRFSPSVICCEEIDMFPQVAETLSIVGYTGIFKAKPKSPCLHSTNNIGPDGCAMFYNKEILDLLDHKEITLKDKDDCLTNQVSIICKYSFKQKPETCFCVAVTHLKAKRGFEEARWEQGINLEAVLREAVQSLPVFICGDFNAEANEKVYEVFNESLMNLKSAYTLLNGNNKEPEYTTWKIRGGNEISCHTIDYIWYKKDKAEVVSLCTIPSDEEIGENRLPSFTYPSDHFSLTADFIL